MVLVVVVIFSVLLGIIASGFGGAVLIRAIIIPKDEEETRWGLYRSFRFKYLRPILAWPMLAWCLLRKGAHEN